MYSSMGNCVVDWGSGRVSDSGSTGCESSMGPLFQFTNGLGQAANNKCAPSRPRSELLPGQGQFLLGCMWNNCSGSNGLYAP